MKNSDTIICTALLMLLLPAESVWAEENDNQYNLGIESLASGSQFSSALDYIAEFEKQHKLTADKSKKKIKFPIVELDVNYQDKPADVFAPYHSFNKIPDLRIDKNTSKEYQTRLEYRFEHLSSEAAVKYSPDSYGMGEYYNYELGVAVPVKKMFSVETRYGWNQFKNKPEKGGMKDYQDWSVGVSTTYKGMKLKVDYIDINAGEKSEECSQNFPCEGKTVFSIIKNF